MSAPAGVISRLFGICPAGIKDTSHSGASVDKKRHPRVTASLVPAPPLPLLRLRLQMEGERENLLAESANCQAEQPTCWNPAPLQAPPEFAPSFVHVVPKTIPSHSCLFVPTIVLTTIQIVHSPFPGIWAWASVRSTVWEGRLDHPKGVGLPWH